VIVSFEILTSVGEFFDELSNIANFFFSKSDEYWVLSLDVETSDIVVVDIGKIWKFSINGGGVGDECCIFKF